MLEADHGGRWRTGAIEHPRGRWVNLPVKLPDVHAVRIRLIDRDATVFQGLRESWHQTAERGELRLELLVQDPDGSLIRLVTMLP